MKRGCENRLPNGHYFASDIEGAIKNLFTGKVGDLPKGPNNAKIRVNQYALLGGTIQILMRLLLHPNETAGPKPTKSRGNIFLWLNGDLLQFGDDGKLTERSKENPVSVEDFLWLDVEIDTPRLMRTVDDLDAVAFFGDMVRDQSLFINPKTWTVRQVPKYSLSSLEEYEEASGLRRHDWEYEMAIEAWGRVRPYAGGRLVFASPKTPGGSEFRLPHEVARLIAPEFTRLTAQTTNRRKRDDRAKELVDYFRSLPELDQRDFFRAEAARILRLRPEGNPFQPAWDTFKDLLTHGERELLPGKGRPAKSQTK